MKKIIKKKSGYDWKFFNCGGVLRVDISSGQDIAHLNELDQKMWTVLSCPTVGLEIDPETLKMLDYDNDGRVHANEIVEASQWLTGLLNDPDMLLRQEDSIPVSAINTQTEEGQLIANSIKQILSNLGLEKDTISVADTADSLAIFNKTRFNGDGVITECTTDDAALQQLIKDIAETCGSLPDRSGEVGIDTDKLEAFYQQCADYQAWKNDGANRAAEVLPFGDKTSDAWNAVQALKDKVNDYFMRCNLASFHNDATAALDVSVTRIETITDKNLTTCMDEIASYPLARINTDKLLHIDGEINPAWADAFRQLKQLVFDAVPNMQNAISENDWKQILDKFTPYIDWQNAKPENSIESLGNERIDEILNQNQKDALLDLIAKDKELEKEANSIDEVNKFLHYYRDFYTLLKNFITFKDFYEKDGPKAIFQAGTLYLDQRSCNLCMKVTDMAKHSTMADFSGMYLIYCDCTCKRKNATMTIVAVLTNGEVNDIMVGKNALFYDRNGVDWDAKVVKIVDNPISIKQAFWSPYRKFGRFVEEQINKFAASKDEKMTGEMTGKISEAGDKLTTVPDPAAAPAAPGAPADKKEKPAPSTFDIAKYCGIFAAIGMALGYIGAFFVSLAKGFNALPTWKIPLVIIGIMLLISGPSMLIAWLKLRKRNLAPILDANGWTVNARAFISIPFGYTLTDLADFPKIKVQDPFNMKKKTSPWEVILYILLILAIAFVALYLCNVLAKFGLPSPL